MNIYFTTVQNIKDKTTIDDSVDDKLILNSIYDSQRIDIEPILGTKLYKKIETDIQNNITGVYKILLDDYIMPTLIKAVERRSVIYIYMKIRPKGIINQDDITGHNVDTQMFNKLRHEILDDFEYYSNRLKSFLIYSDIEEYNGNTEDELKPNKNNAYFSGIHLGIKKNC
jgi:hypothetical protein